MSDALWAAREGDALMHTSMLADIVGGVLEIAATVAIGALATAAVAAAFGLTVATGGLGCFVLGAVVGLVVGVVMAKTGADTGLSRLCEGIGNFLFPPSVQATIASGSSNTKTNGKRAARAAGIVTGPPAPLEQAGAEAGEAKEETFLDMAKGFFSQMWRPTVATPAANTQEAPDDKIACSKHPAMPPQYLAEGSSKVLINGHPACRSGDRSTCEAVIVDGGLVSNNVRIGGEPIVVREIRSGKTPGIGLAVTALMLLRGRGGKFYSKFGCMLVGGVSSFVTGQVSSALTSAIVGSPNPVHASTGAKILGGEEDLDFTLPALLPINWQRFYNSRDDRRDGLFGAGWSVSFEVFVEVQSDRLLYTDEQGRVIDMGQINLGDAVFSASEGLSVRRSHDGQLLIENFENGLYQHFLASPEQPGHLRLASLGDRNDNRIHLAYDERGRLVQLCDTFGRPQLQLRYDGQWPKRVSQVEQVFENGDSEVLMRYRYDERGDLAEVLDAANQTQRRFAYNQQQLMTEHQTIAGLQCFYAWTMTEDGWRVARHWTCQGDEYHFEYDVRAGITRVTDGLQRVSRRRWNPQYQVTEFTDALSQTWRFDWNDDRQLLSATDPQSGRWLFFHDESGNLAETIDPLGRSESTLWLEHWSLPKVRVERDGARWTFGYDARGNCVRLVDPSGQLTRYRHDKHGQIIEIIDASGKSRHQRWNDQGLLREHTDCSASLTRFSYDPRGHLQTITNALGEPQHYTHDQRGRLLSKTFPDERCERFERNARGQLERHVDPAGHVTFYRYDRHGRVSSRTDGNGNSVHMHYDSYGRLQWLANENGERYQFKWDARDRLAEQLNLDGSRQCYTYGSIDEIREIRFKPAADQEASTAIVHRLSVDAVGRLVAKHTDDGTTQYRYDDGDRMVYAGFTDNLGQTAGLAFAYDAQGRLLSETSDSGTLAHSYDELGNAIQTLLPDGRTINRLYYGSGHLHQVNLDGHVISDFERDRLHREVLRTQGGLTTRSEYDRCGRLRGRRSSNAALPPLLPASLQQRFEYDASNNLSAQTQQQSERLLQAWFQHDAAGRILQATGLQMAQAEVFRYDPAANLLDASSGQSRPVRHNRLLSYQDKRYRYDGFGRLVEKRSHTRGVQHLRYDAQHRLVEVRNLRAGRETVVRMHYDPLGRRIAKRTHDDSGLLLDETRFCWDGLKLLMESHYQHKTLYLYVGDSYEPLARVDGSDADQKVGYYHNHLNGLPEKLTDSSGETIWQATYSVWGQLSQQTAAQPCTQNLRFQGQYFDSETGLHFNTFRFYDPDTGRFTQPDPIGLAGGINLYQYCPSPLTWIDPWGLEAVYENPGHHQPGYMANRQEPFNASKSILPQDHETLFKHSVADPDDPKTRWTKVGEGKKAVWHRFQSSAPDGSKPFHWNGSTDGKDMNGRPRAIDKKNVPRFAQKMKGCAL